MKPPVVPAATAELNLLLVWPGRRTRSQWALILGASVAAHLAFFFIGIRVPSLLGLARQPEPEVAYRHIPLYLMTQKAPNQREISKQIDLADLAEARPSPTAPGGRRASVKRFEVPKQTPPRQLARNKKPQILPQAPSVDPAQHPVPSTGVPNGLPAPPSPPASKTAEPFQNIGSEGPINPHPKLFPPKGGVDGAISELKQPPNSPQFSISDDQPKQIAPGDFGTLSQTPAQHAAVELQSDANGADFKIYLRTILAIVRGNWRQVVPESARMGALRGRTVLQFIINRDGSIPKLVTADSSGSDPLDRAAVAGLSMSNPLPPLPADYKGNQVRLAFTFAYNMPAK